MSFFFEMMVFEAVIGNSAFHFRLKQTFSNSIYLEFSRKEDNSGALLIAAVFGIR